jgi:hypothetical protein
MSQICEFPIAAGARKICGRCGKSAPPGRRVIRECTAAELSVSMMMARAGAPGECIHLGEQRGERLSKTCCTENRIAQFHCDHPAHGLVTMEDCLNCRDFAPPKTRTRRLLISFLKGFGDHIQLGVVLRHLRAVHPDWQIDLACFSKCAAGFVEAGLCDAVYPHGRHPLNGYDLVVSPAWNYPTASYAGSPSTAAEVCLLEIFGIKPRPELCGYQVATQQADCEHIRKWVGGQPFALIHHHGNAERERKDVDDDAIAPLIWMLAERGMRSLIIDFDRRSRLGWLPRTTLLRRESPCWPRPPDAACLAALASEAKLCVGIDSGPGKVFGAVGTPTVLVWTGKHPLHYQAPAANCLHLVPPNHEALLLQPRAVGAAYFAEHYRSRNYGSELHGELVAAAAWQLSGLEMGDGLAYQPDRARSVPYDADYWHKYQTYRGKPIAQRINAARIDLVGRHAGPVRLLDVGIGSGEFLETWGGGKGYDINPHAAAWLKERDWWDDPADGALVRASAVTMWDVLEHFSEPEEFLARFRPGQWLFVSLPIFADLWRVPGSKHFKPDEHYRYWTHEGFLQWMRDRGFDCLEANQAETLAGREDIRSYAFRKRPYPEANGQVVRPAAKISRVVQVRTVQGVGDLFWVYQLLAPHCDRLDLEIGVTEHCVLQHRADPFVRLWPKIGDITYRRVPGHEYQAMSRGMFRTGKALATQGLVPFAANAQLESGVRLERIDPAYEVAWGVPMKDKRAELPFNQYATLYVSGSKGWWDSTVWCELMAGLQHRVGRLPLALIGASYDNWKLQEIAMGLVKRGFELEVFIDSPAAKVIDIIRRGKYFVGYQSGLNVLADNFDVPQVMIYFPQLRKMRDTWCKPRHAGKLFHAYFFDDSVASVAGDAGEKLARILS